MSLLIAATCILFITVLSEIHRRLSHRSKSLPPGPPPDSWLFGHKLPDAFAYRKFEEWTKTYGPVFSLRQGFTNVIVIGRYQAAVEIMEREGAALVDRPLSISAGETLSGGMRVVLTPAGDRFKKMRKALHAYLAPKVVQSYGPILMRSAKQHLLDIIDDPSLHQEHAKRYSASVVMSLAYGKTPSSHNDPDVLAVNRCLTRLGVTLRPGVWKVDHFPWLKYVPGYLDELREGHREELGLFKKHLGLVREQMEREKAATNPDPDPSSSTAALLEAEETTTTASTTSQHDSFAQYLLQRQDALSLTDNETAYLAGALFGAGSDTTASAISVAVLAAACYPSAARRVQDELDRVVGRGRVPVPADWDVTGAGGGGSKMPELHAFVLETFRWRPVTAGGMAHKATKDIVWSDANREGGGGGGKTYVIPAGSTVIGNVWSVGRDPGVFPDPERFEPGRWLVGGGGEGERRVRGDLKSYPFGFGRRVCPGQHMATASVLLNTALILWSFNVRPDPKQPPIDELAFTESANAHPRPFNVVFEPRGVDVAGVGVGVGGKEGKEGSMKVLREVFEGYGDEEEEEY